MYVDKDNKTMRACCRCAFCNKRFSAHARFKKNKKGVMSFSYFDLTYYRQHLKETHAKVVKNEDEIDNDEDEIDESDNESGNDESDVDNDDVDEDKQDGGDGSDDEEEKQDEGGNENKENAKENTKENAKENAKEKLTDNGDETDLDHEEEKVTQKKRKAKDQNLVKNKRAKIDIVDK